MSQKLISSLRHCVEDAERRRAEMAQEIEKLDIYIAEQRVKLNQASNTNAPIWRLPDEIIAEILEISHHASSLGNHNKPYELVLSELTKRLREVAINTPLLWTEICITVREHADSASTPGTFSALPLYLYRSKNQPLDLKIVLLVQTHSAHFTDLIGQFLETIDPHICRLRSLSIRARSYKCGIELFQGMRNFVAPLLEHIQFDFGQHDIPRDYSAVDGLERDYFEDIFTGGAPALQEFKLRSLGLHYCLPDTSSIATLKLHIGRADRRVCPDYMTLRSMLTRLHSLTHLIIHGISTTERLQSLDTVSTPQMSLSALNTLHLLSSPWTAPDIHILNFIVAPSLQHLTLEEVHSIGVEALQDNPNMTTTPPRYPSLRNLNITPWTGHFGGGRFDNECSVETSSEKSIFFRSTHP